MTKRIFLLAAAVLLCAAAPAAAQPEPSAAELRAVRELLEVSRARENFIRGMELGMEQSGGADLTPKVRAAVRGFMDEHFRFEDIEPEFAALYTELYTEEEIRGMTAFYRTPLGQRMLETLPELTAGSQRIVMARLQAVMPQLIQRIMDVMEAEDDGGRR